MTGRADCVATTRGCSTARPTTLWLITINLALFWLGPDDERRPRRLSVEAELYRVSPDREFDTLCDAACARTTMPSCSSGSNTHVEETSIQRSHCQANGQPIPEQESIPNWTSRALRVSMFTKFANWARGGDEIVATLSWPRCACACGERRVAVHAGWLRFPREFRKACNRENSTITTIAGIEPMFRKRVRQSVGCRQR